MSLDYAEPRPQGRGTPDTEDLAMIMNRTRLGAWALIVGTLIAMGGYLAAGTILNGTGNIRYTSSLWAPLNGIAIAGDIIVALGLPVLLTYHGRRVPWLTLIGYVGLFATLVMLNIGEGCVEAFIKPYLATHGGIPASAPAGLAVFEGFALVCLAVGLTCLGIAVIRTRVFPRWVGTLFIASVAAGFLGLHGPLALLSDYLAFIAIFAIGVQIVRAGSRNPEPVSGLEQRAQATT